MPSVDVAFLFAPGFRSRAYAQAMQQRGLVPALAIKLEGAEPEWTGRQHIESKTARLTFRPAEPAADTLAAMAVPIQPLSGMVNSAAAVEAVRALSQPIVVYCGPGGVILREPMLNTGKRFLHVHGGVAPHYRGSTAFYFSLLRDGRIGASALYLDKGIDTGPIIMTKSHPPEPGIDIDRALDPMIRADVLCDVLTIIARGTIPNPPPASREGTTYHVIHPVLKHLALRKAGAA